MVQDQLTRAEYIRLIALSQAIQSTRLTVSSDITELLARAEKIEAWLRGMPPAPEKPRPVIPVDQSVTPGHVTCLVCGKKNKMLKRHLKAAHGLTPAEYRERFGLRSDYPLTAPEYSDRRSDLAREIGLGKVNRPEALPARAAKAEG